MLLEAFTVLLRDLNHWFFEFLVGGIEELVTGVIIGAVLWPRVMRHWHRDSPHKDKDEVAYIPTLWSADVQKALEFDSVIGKRLIIPHLHFNTPLPPGYLPSRSRRECEAIHARERRSAAAKKGWETRRRHEAD